MPIYTKSTNNSGSDCMLSALIEPRTETHCITLCLFSDLIFYMAYFARPPCSCFLSHVIISYSATAHDSMSILREVMFIDTSLFSALH